MYKLKDKSIVTITPGVAEELRKINTLEYQRPLRIWHVRVLAQKIRTGTFRTGEIGIAIASYNLHKNVLVNGQHQIEAVIRTGIPIDAKQEIFICDTAEDLSLLYRQFDNTPIRTIRDMTRGELYTLGVDWSPLVASLLVNALFSLSGKDHSTPREERVELLGENRPACNFVNSILTGSNTTRILRRAPVVAAMISSWKKNKEDARNFWMSARDGEKLDKGMPAWVLRNFLINCNMKYGTLYRRPTAKEVYSRCAHAWNAYRQNRTTKLAYHSSAPLPRFL